MDSKLWKLPCDEAVEASIENDEVCIVGMFGKSMSGHISKSMVLNKVITSAPFPPHYPIYSTNRNGGETNRSENEFQPRIEGFYDKEKKIVFLNLTTVLDVSTLATACAIVGRDLDTHSASHDFWKSQEVETVFSLVYLFSICHVLLLVHPVSTFDISYDKLFHHVGNLRTKLLPSIKDVLKECTVGRDWWVNGRPCPPRLLFVMQKSHLTKADNTPTAESATKKKKTPLKRLHHTLEDQVYKILRNSRVLTNNAVNCLFTVPPNQAFVHIMTEQFERTRIDEDPVKSMMRLLRKSCETHRNPKARSRSYRLLTNPPTEWEDSDEDDGKENQLWSFISQHTDLVLEKKGFKDSVGRNQLATHFEIPSLKNWMKVANKLHCLLLSRESDYEELKRETQGLLDTEARFSEARCSKLVSVANAVYQSNLPMHYTSKVHGNQLVQALAHYDLHARGPAKDRFRERVNVDCDAFWNDGRRLCEVRSLTSRHCVHRFHDLPVGTARPQPDADPPVMYHSSRSRSVAASNCGRIQGPREDPFTLKDANHDFYHKLAQRVMAPSESDIYQFPTHFVEKADKSPLAPPVSTELHEFVEQLRLDSPETPELTLEGAISQKESAKDATSDDSTQESEANPKTSQSDVRQPSAGTTFEFSLNSDTVPEPKEEPLDVFTEGMTHSLCTDGVLPLFSSWALTRIGPASTYNTSHGLDMPGFIPGTNHLVSWDIPFQSDEPGTTHWPVPGEARKMTIKETKLMQRETTTRGYVGYEYETPRGQRFICSAPDKAVKVSNSGVVRDPIQPLLDNDMPLFTPSPVSGRSGKMLTGQLMRVIVVTPSEANVHITIRPQVTPGPPPAPTFYPSQREIPLRANSVWVLRLPYVYVSEMGSHVQPKDCTQTSDWKAAKMLCVTVDQ